VAAAVAVAAAVVVAVVERAMNAKQIRSAGLSAELVRIVVDEVNKESVPIRVKEAGVSADHARVVFLHEMPGGEPIHVGLPLVTESRCVLVIDIVGFTKRRMEEQVVLAATMNRLLRRSRDSLPVRHPLIRTRMVGTELWDLYKGTGDGAIFVFGHLVDPSAIRDALAFASWVASNIAEHNSRRPPDAIDQIEARMALAYGNVYAVDGLDDRPDILGDAINLAARLVASKKNDAPGSILVDSSIMLNIQLPANRAIYFENQDGSQPAHGALSDYFLGVTPSPDDHLSLEDDGIHPIKNHKLHAFSVRGRLAGRDVGRPGIPDPHPD
jgi:class 3 adenylate cyclase